MKLTFANDNKVRNFVSLCVGDTFITAKYDRLSDVQVVWMKVSPTRCASIGGGNGTDFAEFDQTFPVHKVRVQSAVIEIV